MTIRTILILLVVSLLLVEFPIIIIISLPLKSEAYETQKQYQKYNLNIKTLICASPTPKNYTFSQEFVNFRLRTSSGDSEVNVNSTVILKVYDESGNLVANSSQTDIQLKTQEGLPFDKQTEIYLTCTKNTISPGRQFPVIEVITIKEDGGLLFSVSPLSLDQEPVVNDPNLKVEVVYKGINFPTSMAFLAPNDILVLEKNTGKVRRIVNGQLLKEPLLDVNVAGNVENGLLGIAVSKKVQENTYRNGEPVYVFLYFTQANSDKDYQGKEKEPLANRLYRYQLINNKLENPKLLLNLPAAAWAIHNGGKVVIGPDENVYVVVGDIVGINIDKKTKAQNYKNGTDPDGRAGILRITQDGKPVGGAKGILGDKYPLNLYYAYGIRSSFGIDFDPVTGNLWDTENGPLYGDEINLIYPGFNSGWVKVQGLWEPSGPYDYYPGKILITPNDLVDFGGKGNYSSPKFIWMKNVGPTDLTFLKSDKLGKRYQNDMFVGDVKYGNLYHFDLNLNRKDLLLPANHSLADKIADNLQENEEAVFARGFGGITDIEVGPDGYLYVASIKAYVNDIHEGTLYRIVPKTNNNLTSVK